MHVTTKKSNTTLGPQKTEDKLNSYQRNVVEVTPFRKVKDGVLELSTNIQYYAKSKIYGFARNMMLFSSDQQIYIFYQKFENEKEAQHKIQSLIWFSYRQIPGLNQSYNGDNGWGCLIRVGQMAFAHGLQKYLQEKYWKNKKSEIRYQIINAFLESDGYGEKYSLRKIVDRAANLFELKYGSWFNSNQICEVLTYLHATNPMKGTEMLGVINFKGNYVSIEDMQQQMKIKVICKCDKKRILCRNCRNSSKLSRDEKKLIVFVNCLLGVGQVTEKAFLQLKQLLNLKCSLGIVGGIPKRGLYFVGYQEMQLICLDPHKVQKNVTPKNLEKMMKTFECPDFLKHKRSMIDPSMAFVFYLDNLEAMNQLYDKIQSLTFDNNPILSVEWGKQLQRNRHIYELSHQRNLRNSFVGTI